MYIVQLYSCTLYNIKTKFQKHFYCLLLVSYKLGHFKLSPNYIYTYIYIYISVNMFLVVTVFWIGKTVIIYTFVYFFVIIWLEKFGEKENIVSSPKTYYLYDMFLLTF